MYSQNSEEKHIVNHLKGFTGTLLSIGENDGKTLSNSLSLIQLGWQAILVEPSKLALKKLRSLHKSNKKIKIIPVAIGLSNCKMILHESGHHYADKSDIALLSTLKQEETMRWKGVHFKPYEVDVADYNTLLKLAGTSKFDFITIDAEGMDLDILRQIQLSEVKLLCIEWNSKEEIKKQIMDYCANFGMNKIIYQSPENLLICR